MKKSIIFVFTVTLVFFANLFCPVGNVLASSEYARILNENTMFYSNPDCTVKRFVLPYGYFVKILQIGVDSTKVCYMEGRGNLPERIGYIKTSDLYFFDEEVVDPYPDLSLTLLSDEVLFADTDMQHPKTVLSAGQPALFYGELEIFGEPFCCVYSNGFIGYVRKSAFASFTLLDHPFPIINNEELPVSSTENLNASQTSSAKQIRLDETLKIVLIVAVCVACVSIVYLIFKPKCANLKPSSVYEEDDYF